MTALAGTETGGATRHRARLGVEELSVRFGGVHTSTA